MGLFGQKKVPFELIENETIVSKHWAFPSMVHSGAISRSTQGARVFLTSQRIVVVSKKYDPKGVNASIALSRINSVRRGWWGRLTIETTQDTYAFYRTSKVRVLQKGLDNALSEKSYTFDSDDVVVEPKLSLTAKLIKGSGIVAAEVGKAALIGAVAIAKDVMTPAKPTPCGNCGRLRGRGGSSGPFASPCPHCGSISG